MYFIHIPEKEVPTIQCPDCREPMLPRVDKRGNEIFKCWKKGCHGNHRRIGDQPLGIPADSKTRKRRVRLHEILGKIWDYNKERNQMYHWLSQFPKGHIAQMSIPEMDAVQTKLSGYYGRPWGVHFLKIQVELEVWTKYQIQQLSQFV